VYLGEASRYLGWSPFVISIPSVVKCIHLSSVHLFPDCIVQFNPVLGSSISYDSHLM
jgi:hypothetical protein